MPTDAEAQRSGEWWSSGGILVTLHTQLCPGCSLQHGHCLSPCCTVAKMMLSGRLHGLSLAWTSTFDAVGNQHCGCCWLHGSAMPPPSPLPRRAAAEPGWHPWGYGRNFPLGKAAQMFALIRLQRNAKGAREMKHIPSQPNGQTNTGENARKNELRPKLRI